MALLVGALTGRWCSCASDHCCSAAPLHASSKKVAAEETQEGIHLAEESYDPEIRNSQAYGMMQNSALPLGRLQDAFDLFGGNSVRISSENLVEVFKHVARPQCKLDDEEICILTHTAQHYIKEMDFMGANDGRVSFIDVAAFMLDMRAKTCSQIRPYVMEQVKLMPGRWDEVVLEFLQMNTSQGGFVTQSEFSAFVGPSFMNSATFDRIDCNNDGLLDIWEYAAYRFNLERVPVELLLYDLSEGIAEQFSSLLLGERIDAVYHTSILVHGKEYFYGKFVYQNATPPLHGQFGSSLKKFAEPLRTSQYLHSVDVHPLGYTFATEESVKGIASTLAGGCYGPGRYHPLTNNCNHFAHEFAMLLTGAGVPAAVRKQTEMFLRSSALKAILPAISSWHGLFGDTELAQCLEMNGNCRSPDSPFAVMSATAHLPATWVEVEKPMDLVGQICSFKLGGNNVTDSQSHSLRWRRVRFGIVVSADRSAVNVRWFEPATCTFCSSEGIPLSSVMSWHPSGDAYVWHYNHNMNKYYVVDI